MDQEETKEKTHTKITIEGVEVETLFKIARLYQECDSILRIIAKWKKDPKIRSLEFTSREWQALACTLIISTKEFISWDISS